MFEEDRASDRDQREGEARRPHAGRGRCHPRLPLGAGLGTFVRNTSRYPGAEVRTLVEFAAQRCDVRGVCFNVKNMRRGGVRGRAYGGVPAPRNVPVETLYVVTIGLGAPETFPVGEHRYGFVEPGPRNKFPLLAFADWREGLVATAAHEAKHIEQYKLGRPRSELETSWYEHDVLDEYRQRLKGNGQAIAVP